MSKHERVARLMKIVTFIKAQKNLHRKDLANKCEVSVRTIQRDIDTLIYAGIPIFWSEGGYQIMPDFFLPPVNLSVEEAFHLVLATKAFSEDKGESQKHALEYALSKIIARLPEDTRYRLETILSRSISDADVIAIAQSNSP